MKEQTLLFGADSNLVGVLSESDDGPDPRLPAVLLLNAGMLHRIGPFRLYVDLARDLAAAGWLCLRFDLSGVGDSPAPAAGAAAARRNLADIGQAMDQLAATRGCDRFCLMGLCSGADNSFAAASADPRVAGAVLLDGFGYRTFGYQLRHYGPRLLKPMRWPGYLSRLLKIGSGDVPSNDTVLDDPYVRTFPPREKTAARLHELIERDTRLLFVYSGGVSRYHNYERQLEDAFPMIKGDDRVEVIFNAGADHTYALLSDRRMLREQILDWAKRQFARGDQGGPSSIQSEALKVTPE